MKRMTSTILIFFAVAGMVFIPTSCTEDLLDQKHTTEVDLTAFWKTEADANAALMGTYNSVRQLFDRDYYFDGQGEYVRDRSGTNSTGTNNPYNGADYNPSGYGDNFDKYFRYCYGAVNRCNYFIENATKMLETASGNSATNLELMIAEARLLRGMVYFRLISMWGDVPYFENVLQRFEDAPEWDVLSRTPITEIKDKIMDDFTFAYDRLPVPSPQVLWGKPTKASALALRGKLQLYWGCWNKFGWPELTTFTPDLAAATAAFTAAADDFRIVINNYGLDLYRGGAPGNIDVLGKASILPNYYYLFTPLSNDKDENKEFIMFFTHGGINTGQGEELMRDFAGRSHEGSQCWVSPRFELADRYQLTTTGNFATKLVPRNPNVPATGNTARTTANSAVNPASYNNRDYRMKSTIQWDFEVSVGMSGLKSLGIVPFIYTTWAQVVKPVPAVIGGVNVIRYDPVLQGEVAVPSYISYNTDGTNTGYVFRKFVRNYAGQGRSDGNFSWPVIRLADVFLMYAEATNEVSGPQADAIALVNRIRARAALPPLPAAATASKTAFWAAIDQERIVELVAEGHRPFDLRRRRRIEEVWGYPYPAKPDYPGSAGLPNYINGVQYRSTHGANTTRYFQNFDEQDFQQMYIFRIPPGERDRNPNLTQNTPWL